MIKINKDNLVKSIVYIFVIASIIAIGRFMWRIYVNGT